MNSRFYNVRRPTTAKASCLVAHCFVYYARHTPSHDTRHSRHCTSNALPTRCSGKRNRGRRIVSFSFSSSSSREELVKEDHQTNKGRREFSAATFDFLDGPASQSTAPVQYGTVRLPVGKSIGKKCTARTRPLIKCAHARGANATRKVFSTSHSTCPICPTTPCLQARIALSGVC